MFLRKIIKQGILVKFSYLFGIALLMASAFINIFPPETASAHYTTVTGIYACQTDGTKLVTWKIQNSESNYTEEIWTLSRSLTGVLAHTSSLTGTIISKSSYVYGTEIVPGSQTGTISLKVKGKWSDGYSQEDTGSVNLGKACATPTSTLAPTLTSTLAPTSTSTLEPTLTFTPTETSTSEPTLTFTPTLTSTSEPTLTFTPTETSTSEPTLTSTLAFTPTSTLEFTPTSTLAFTPTSTLTSPPRMTICVNGETITVDVADLGQYEGYQEGVCPNLTPTYVPPTTICFNGETLEVSESELEQYSGYTTGECTQPTPPPTPKFDLQLNYVCKVTSMDWSVTNPNSFAVTADWELDPAVARGAGSLNGKFLSSSALAFAAAVDQGTVVLGPGEREIVTSSTAGTHVLRVKYYFDEGYEIQTVEITNGSDYCATDPTPVSTLPKPDSQSSLLIPVTGADLHELNLNKNSETGKLFALLGLISIGFGMILQGFTKKQ